jgi:hydrogenase/urease accessory protein HupE
VSSRAPIRLLAAVVLLMIAQPAFAHEVRPGYLELREVASGEFAVLWKVPMRGDARLSLRPRLPDACETRLPSSGTAMGGAMVERWSVTCSDGLRGGAVAIVGLENTLTDALVRIQRLDGSSQTARLTPDSIAFEIRPSTKWDVATTYLGLGVTHILEGVDHLLFVFALLLIVSGWKMLIATVTAFTVAHSITLAAAVLGFVHVPQRPVEAVIALSILFLAVEIVHARQGRPGLAIRKPWVVAFVFGLLHGLGFAGALTETGLPSHAVPLALLFFNVGVELGQLLFVGTLVVVHGVWLRLADRPPAWVYGLLAYAIGGLAAYWTIDRTVSFWS